MEKQQNQQEFQFHYGSIKRQYTAKIKNFGYQFQFHYGSIKS